MVDKIIGQVREIVWRFIVLQPPSTNLSTMLGQPRNRRSTPYASSKLSGFDDATDATLIGPRYNFLGSEC